MNPAPPENPLVISYLMLRKALGALGIALPFLVSIGALVIFRTGLQESISAYYDTGTRDVFVGTLCAIGFFLFAYNGYGPADKIAGNFGSVFAVGTALFPTAPAGHSCKVEQIYCVHGVFAASLFLTLTFFSLFLFTRTDPSKGPPTPQKLRRNLVYKVCGGIMLAAILLVPILHFLPENLTAGIMELDPVFWLESIAVIAFGVSWLTKGEAILADQ